jgi:hypothetical protein
LFDPCKLCTMLLALVNKYRLQASTVLSSMFFITKIVSIVSLSSTTLRNKKITVIPKTSTNEDDRSFLLIELAPPPAPPHPHQLTHP